MQVILERAEMQIDAGGRKQTGRGGHGRGSSGWLLTFDLLLVCIRLAC